MTQQELEEIGSHPQAHASINFRQILRLIGNRNVFLLFFSYMCMNYTFYLLSNWVFLYLIQDRHFSSLDSAFLSMAPPLGAAVGAGLGGVATSLTEAPRQSPGSSYRAALRDDRRSAAVAAHRQRLECLSCVGRAHLVFSGCRVDRSILLGRRDDGREGDSMAVCGFINTGGNLGGIIGIPIVAYFSGLHAWYTAFFIGAGFAVVSAASWLGIRVSGSAAATTALAPQAASA